VNYDSVEVPRHLLEELVKCLEAPSKKGGRAGSATYSSQPAAAGNSPRADHRRREGLPNATKSGRIPILEKHLANLSRHQSPSSPMIDPRIVADSQQPSAEHSSRGDYRPLAAQPGRIPALENALSNLSGNQSLSSPMIYPGISAASQRIGGFPSRGDDGLLEGRPDAHTKRPG
jgi:hypothetical protein